MWLRTEYYAVTVLLVTPLLYQNGWLHTVIALCFIVIDTEYV